MDINVVRYTINRLPNWQMLAQFLLWKRSVLEAGRAYIYIYIYLFFIQVFPDDMYIPIYIYIYAKSIDTSIASPTKPSSLASRGLLRGCLALGTMRPGV